MINNKIQIIGNLGNTPVLKMIGEKRMTKVSLAVNELIRYKDGTRVRKTTWHTVVFWGRLAEQMVKYSKKGTTVLVNGRLKNKSFENRKGQVCVITEIVGMEAVINYLHHAA